MDNDFLKVIAHQKQAMSLILESLSKTFEPIVDTKIEQRKEDELWLKKGKK